MAWAQKEHKLQVVSLAADERARWDGKLKPMEDEWVKEMNGKGFNGKQLLDGAKGLIVKYTK